MRGHCSALVSSCCVSLFFARYGLPRGGSCSAGTECFRCSSCPQLFQGGPCSSLEDPCVLQNDRAVLDPSYFRGTFQVKMAASAHLIRSKCAHSDLWAKPIAIVHSAERSEVPCRAILGNCPPVIVSIGSTASKIKVRSCIPEALVCL